MMKAGETMESQEVFHEIAVGRASPPLHTKEFGLFILNDIASLAEENLSSVFYDAILFGSYAKGSQTEQPDIDICVILNVPSRDIYLHQTILIQRSLDLLCEYDIDPSLFVCSLDKFNTSFSLVYDEIRKWGISWRKTLERG
ncbi:nucleotidyltransferase domain-containing protein [Paenibacillus cymbidii]|uniref:nucleotidyltransferase domain-containing protein n=1 Tax=Paenibacillus cymbidii TaxID=1639034 RepID=UPI001081ABEA